MHLRVDKAASLCIRPRVPAADGPVYALWPSGYESAAHEGLLLLLLTVVSSSGARRIHIPSTRPAPVVSHPQRADVNIHDDVPGDLPETGIHSRFGEEILLDPSAYQYVLLLTIAWASNIQIIPTLNAREVQFCMPKFDEAKKKLDYLSFTVVGLRLAKFQDGERLTWWCGCTSEKCTARQIFQGLDFLDQESSSYLHDRAYTCIHLQAILVSDAMGMPSFF